MSAHLGCSASCPLVEYRHEALEFPVGQLWRVGAVEPEVDETKRNILKLAAVAGVLGVGVGGVVGGTLQYVQPPAVGLASYPKVQLLDLNGSPLTATKFEAEYNVGSDGDLLFYYPLRNEPNFLLNLYPVNGQAPSATNPGAANVLGGVGTHGSIVAFSGICQHLGCPLPAISYYPPRTALNSGTSCTKTFGSLGFYVHCSCHGSTYDVTNGASNLTGPAVLPLPQVVLYVDPVTNIIYAVGENGPPVNGHLNTLQGDYGVGSTSQLETQPPVISCSFPS